MSNKVAVVVGGGSGMGAAAARRLAQDGFQVAVLSSSGKGEALGVSWAAFTKLFADEHAAHNVRMNKVLPGWIDSLPAKEERRESVPMQRYGTSEEVAATIALASEGAAYITGQNIRVDGGLMRSV